MRTKVCSKCGPQSITHFGYKDKAKKLFQSFCRPCQNTNSKKWYKKNRAQHCKNVSLNRNAIRQANQEKVAVYLSKNPCVSCKETDIVVLDFDHIKGTKFMDISRMMLYSWRIIMKEILKCQVLCANCHRRITAKRGNHYKFRWCRQRDLNSHSSA